MSTRICIAIDGPASSGKGTVARLVARALDYAYVDTGAMYRAVALVARERGVPWSDGPALGALAAGLDFAFAWDGERLRLRVDGRDVPEAIRDEEIGRGASAVAVHPPVRSALLARQQAMGEHGGVVMDGRDIGTVVLPGARLKVFLDATPEERARRRTLELVARGQPADPQVILAEIQARDLQDATRATAPLLAAPDALHLDSTGRGPEEVAAQIEQIARARSLDDQPENS